MALEVVDERRRLRRRLLVGAATVAACAALVPATGHAAPPGRAYELVSPPAKFNGGVAFGHRASDDGNAVAFLLNAATGPDDGAFALTPHVARRGANGWSSRSAAPPLRAEHRGSSGVSAWPADFNADFSRALIQTNDPIDPADREPVEEGTLDAGFDLYSFDPIGRTAAWISRPLPALAPEYGAGAQATVFAGQSTDGSHVVFMSARRLVPEAPDGITNEAILYESVAGVPRLVAVLPDGTPAPGSSRIASPLRLFMTGARARQAVSADGSRIYWTDGGGGDPPLYLREDGVRTLVVSQSRRQGEEGLVAPGTFLGATQDGARVYFSSTAPLTDDAPGGGVYAYDREGERLTFLFEADGFDSTGAYGPVLSEGGERLYFTTSGRGLAGAPDGGRNLYVWDGELRHVAEISADTGLYADPRLRVSPDGRYAAFTSTLSLDPRHVDGTVAVYRYDAQSGAVACASCRTDGVDGAGPAELMASVSRYTLLANVEHVSPRNLSEDGRLYFQTPDPLVPEDRNGAIDVYEFDGARATLISSGQGEGSDLVDNSADGTSVFFVTADALVRGDRDGGYPDVYVARVGGGFPDDPEPPESCSGETCQGPLTPPPTFPPPASELVDPPADTPAARPRTTFAVVRPGARQLRRFAARGRIDLRVEVGSAGSVSATARARVGRRSGVVATARSRATRAGSVTLSLRLSQAARERLAARGRLAVAVTVRFSRASAPKRLTLTLRRAGVRRGGRRAGSGARVSPSESSNGRKR